ncbi:TIGR02453 family protein [Methylocapsa sp. S129]|uniref:TIGR02453 family protein n=1 Tax=Methylocapsa sp. S129 TaxID=1641869 RepID=UPI00131CA094|nr:TIGR02453 family protein [Methylocapsa sp. S129]
MSFKGFGADALPFFKALGFHQTKEWFDENRATYESQIKAPFGDLIEDLSAAFAKAGVPLKGDRKASLFRLNRDIRFAKDKSPYKTHAGAVLTRGGAKNDKGLFYIHIAPDGCFVAAGFYHPEPDDLARLRRAIARAPKDYEKVMKGLDKAGIGMRDDESLTRLPRGFETVTDPKIAAAVMKKSFIGSKPIAAARLAKPALIDDLVAFGKQALPLLQWGWGAVVDER